MRLSNFNLLNYLSSIKNWKQSIKTTIKVFDFKSVTEPELSKNWKNQMLQNFVLCFLHGTTIFRRKYI